MSKQPMQDFRERMSKSLNVPEEQIANWINELVILDKRYAEYVQLVEKLSDALAISLAVFNRQVFKDNMNNEAKIAYIKTNLMRAIGKSIRATIPPEDIDNFLMQLQIEIEGKRG